MRLSWNPPFYYTAHIAHQTCNLFLSQQPWVAQCVPSKATGGVAQRLDSLSALPNTSRFHITRSSLYRAPERIKHKDKRGRGKSIGDRKRSSVNHSSSTTSSSIVSAAVAAEATMPACLPIGCSREREGKRGGETHHVDSIPIVSQLDQILCVHHPCLRLLLPRATWWIRTKWRAHCTL